MVLPSGVAAANALKPIVPEAPSRLFTTTCWPDWSAMALATARPITSTPLPAGNGMIISIGRAGHFCAFASSAIGASAIAATTAPFQLMPFPPPCPWGLTLQPVYLVEFAPVVGCGRGPKYLARVLCRHAPSF